MPRKIKTNVYLDARQIKELKKIAETTDVSMARLIRRGVEIVIKRYRGRKSIDP